MLHYQPNDRPIHPSCATLDDADSYCTCEEEWRGWDGTATGLDHAIKMLAQVEARRRPSTYRGHAPDADETDLLLSNRRRQPMDSNDPDSYWKESEFLKCAKLSNRE